MLMMMMPLMMPPTPFPDLRQAPAPPVTSLFHASSMKLAGERILAAARATTEAIVHGDGPNKVSEWMVDADGHVHPLAGCVLSPAREAWQPINRQLCTQLR